MVLQKVLDLSTTSLPVVHILMQTTGGWESIDWTKIDYPKGTGADAVPKGTYTIPPLLLTLALTLRNLLTSSPTGGWERIKYPPSPAPPAPAPPSCPPPPPSPFTFTSTYAIHATPEQVVNNSNVATGGLSGTTGLYLLGLDSTTNTICYNITLHNFGGEYSSPARTATHLHEARVGMAGPPRIAFPNPIDVPGMEGVKRSVGCLMGPFTTGLNGTGANAGVDTGSGFHVSAIEKDPAGFFVDVHSSLAVPGAVRGQVA